MEAEGDDDELQGGAVGADGEHPDLPTRRSEPDRGGVGGLGSGGGVGRYCTAGYGGWRCGDEEKGRQRWGMTLSEGRMTPLDPAAEWGGGVPLTVTAAGVGRRRQGQSDPKP